MSQDPSKINSTKPIVPSVTSIKREVSQNDACKRIAEMTGYLVHCANCSAAVIIYPPGPEYEIILVEPCPMCNGSEQNFKCDYCFQKNTIYWDERHFVSKAT
jgi:hypothetical protein